MVGFREDEEIPLLLVKQREVGGAEAALDLAEIDAFEARYAAPPVGADRMRPATSGALVGLAAGAAALGMIQFLAPELVGHLATRAAATRGVAVEVALGVGYATAAACGGLLGACFGVVTRYLRRFFPLLIWSLVFFVSVALLGLAALRSPQPPAISVAVIAASAVFGAVLTLSLPLRRRGSA